MDGSSSTVCYSVPALDKCLSISWIISLNSELLQCEHALVSLVWRDVRTNRSTFPTLYKSSTGENNWQKVITCCSMSIHSHGCEGYFVGVKPLMGLLTGVFLPPACVSGPGLDRRLRGRWVRRGPRTQDQTNLDLTWNFCRLQFKLWQFYHYFWRCGAWKWSELLSKLHFFCSSMSEHLLNSSHCGSKDLQYVGCSFRFSNSFFFDPVHLFADLLRHVHSGVRLFHQWSFNFRLRVLLTIGCKEEQTLNSCYSNRQCDVLFFICSQWSAASVH